MPDQDPRPPETDPPEPDAAPSLRPLPWPAVAAGVVLFLALILTAALLADRNTRGRLVGDTQQTIESSATQPTKTPIATLDQNNSEDSERDTPSSLAVTNASTTTPKNSLWWSLRSPVDSVLETELLDAYKHYWDIVGQAYLNLDESQLSDVESGQELQRDQEVIHQLSSEGKAQKLIIDHSVHVLYGTKDEAVIYDEYVSQSVYITITTGDEIPTDNPPSSQKIAFHLEILGGKWRVVDGVRYS